MSPQGVAIVAPSAYLLGGVQTWLDYVVPGLEARGWTATVLLVHGDASDAHAYLKAHPFTRASIVRNPTGSREGRVRALQRAIAAEDPGIVLVVNVVDAFDAVSRLRRKGGKVRALMALHGFNPAFFLDMCRYRSTLDGVIATNRLGTEAAVSLGGMEGSRVYYAACGVVVPDAIAEGVHPETLELLYAGRFDEREKRVMDLPLILAALARSGNAFRLRLAGSGPAEGKLREALAPFGECVEFLGELDEAGMRSNLYRAGAILLLMSPSESGPLVAWEAMACGVAVVTARFVGMGLEGSLVDGRNCLVYPVGDADAAAAAIARFADPAFSREIRSSGYELVARRYSRDASIRAWDGALRHALAQLPLRPEADASPAQPSGRLDRWLGIGLAESVRRAAGTRFRHRSPGAEWPHTYQDLGQEVLWEQLTALDRTQAS